MKLEVINLSKKFNNIFAVKNVNLICHIYIAGKHWNWAKQTVSKFEMEIPAHLILSNFAERIGTKVDTKPDGVDVQISGNKVTLKNMNLDDKNVARIFTFDISQ